MRLILILLISVSISIGANSQSLSIADSLEAEIPNAKNENDRLYLMLDILQSSRNDFVKTEKYMDQAIALAGELGDKRGEAEALNLKAAYFLQKNKIDESFEIVLEVIEIYKEEKDTINVGQANMNIAMVMLSERRYDVSKKYLEQARSIFESINHIRGLGSAELSLGYWWQFQKNADSSLFHFSEGAKIYDELGIIGEAASCYWGIGNACKQLGKYDEAIVALTKARELTLMTSRAENAEILLDLHHAYLKTGNLDQSKYWAQLGLESALQQHDFNGISKFYKGLYKLDSLKGNWKEASEHLFRAHLYYDSLTQQETAYKVEYMEAEYRAGKTEAELEQSRLNELLESEKSAKNKMYWIFSSIGAVLILIMALFIISRQKLKIKAKTSEAELKQLELEHAENEKQRLQDKVDHKERELTIIALANAEKMEMLERIKAKVGERDGSNQLVELKTLLNDQSLQANEWNEFKVSFEQVHPDFTNKLLMLGPDLTANDIKICILLRLNFSSKQISTMVGISPKSVDMNRYRIRKKIGLDSSRNLQDYILTI